MFLCRFVIILSFSFQVFSSQGPYKGTETCIIQGLQCTDDCSGVLYCTDRDKPAIRAVNCNYYKNTKCFSNYTAYARCYEKVSDCNNQNRGTFRCNEAGYVPDPFNCRKSYKCSKDRSNPVGSCLCGFGSLWISPTECISDEKAIQACCRDFVVDCRNKKAGDFGVNCPLSALGYYYTCDSNAKYLTASTLRCPPGQIFDGSVSKCKAAVSSSVNTTATPTKAAMPPVLMEPYCFKN